MSTVLILSKRHKNEYETDRLNECFMKRGINFQECHPDSFDLIIESNSTGIKLNGKKFEMPSLILVRLGAGITVNQLALIKQFELNGVKVINPSHTIELVADKFRSGQILNTHNISVPKTMIFNERVSIEQIDEEFGFPCIIKVNTGSFGDGVYLCHSKEEFHNVEALWNNEPKQMIIQEYLNTVPGEDLRVIVIGGEAIGVMKRTSPQGDFRANITAGGTGSKFELTKEICDIAVNTCEVLNLQIAGIDLLFDPRGFRVCEANSNPGFKGFETYCEVDVANKIVDFIESNLK